MKSAFNLKTLVWLLVVGVISKGAATSTTTSPSSASTASTMNKPLESHYRFHYMVRDDKTGDYKAQEERRSGDGVIRGFYKLAEPNGDLRVVNYVADVTSGFRASVNIQPGASPMKLTATTRPNSRDAAAGIPSAVASPYNNYRAGISAAPKNIRKPVRGFNPIVVKSVAPQPIPPAAEMMSLQPPQLTLPPYAFYKEAENRSTTSVLPNKPFPPDSIFHKPSTEMPILAAQEIKSTIADTDNQSYNLQSLSHHLDREQANNHTKSTTLGQSTFTPYSSDLYQLHNADIPSSIMEILSQHKSQTVSQPDTMAPTSSTSITPVETAHVNSIPVSLSKIDSPETDTPKSMIGDNLPQRPMRLMGLNPIYMESSQLQSIAENLPASIPQLHVEALSNIQYAAPIPLQWGPLTGGPAGPFHNIPRFVNEPNSEISYVNSMPLFNSIPIVPPQALPAADVKPELKLENNKPPPFPFCSDCLIPANYIPYSVVRAPIPAPGATPIGGPAPSSNPKSPCPSNPPAGAIPAAAAPLWPPYTPSIAYILMPTSYIKGKINETRPLSANIYYSGMRND